MRIVKEAKTRREEILDVADKLFGEKGFEGASTNDILNEVGIARGTLYYHFKSKEDILEALVERYQQMIVCHAKEQANRKNCSLIERIFMVVASLNLSQYSKHSEVWIQQIHKPQNAFMRQKVQTMLIKNITPILVELIQQGIDEGIFRTSVPYECMEMVLVYATTILDDNLLELTEKEQQSRVQALTMNIERMLDCQILNIKEKMKDTLLK